MMGTLGSAIHIDKNKFNVATFKSDQLTRRMNFGRVHEWRRAVSSLVGHAAIVGAEVANCRVRHCEMIHALSNLTAQIALNTGNFNKFNIKNKDLFKLSY